jgi:anti-sigma factor RsiW
MEACENRLASLVDAAAGELPSPERSALDVHLATCTGCRSELKALTETSDLLVATSKTPDDFHLLGFAHRVADRAEGFRDRSARGLWWSITRGARVAMSFSVSALAASLALFVASQHSGRVSVGGADAGSVALADSDDWTDFVPEAVSLLERAGPSVDVNESTDQPASLDSGLDGLSTDELDALADSLDQQTSANSSVN